MAIVTYGYLQDLPIEGIRFFATLRESPRPGTGVSQREATSSPKQSVSSRLAELRDLLDRGLITKGEYDQKRKAILDEL
jgi:hypothetical protein